MLYNIFYVVVGYDVQFYLSRADAISVATELPVLNYFIPTTIFRENGQYYRQRAWFENELSKHFNLTIFCQVSQSGDIDSQTHQKLSEDITIVDFFGETEIIHFVKNYQKYRTKIYQDTDPETELYLTLYPYRKTSIFLSHILSNQNLSIWCKSDYVGLFGNVANYPPKRRLKQVLKPAVSTIYPQVTKRIFEENVVFYTGDVIYDEWGHINQYGITSLSPLNRNQDRIRREQLGKAVFVGNDDDQKGLKYALEALRKYDHDISLTIIGMEDLGRFKPAREHLDVNVAGVIYDNNEFYDVLAEHDMLLMPSICERQGKVQIEAMSAGVVPICSDSGGTYTTVEHMYNGLLFEERNVDALVDAIDRLHTNPALYKKLQNRGLADTGELHIADQVEKMATIMKNWYIE